MQGLLHAGLQLSRVTVRRYLRLWDFLVSQKAKLEIFSFSRPLTGAPCAT